jgi:hypothetical protein
MADLTEALRPLIEEIKTKTATGDVAQELFDQINRAVFTILDEPTRIKELERNKWLREDMKTLFEFEIGLSELGTPYLEQIKQTSCYAVKNCLFRLGSTFHESSCNYHYVCEKHKELPCQVCGEATQMGPATEGAKSEKPSADQTSEAKKENHDGKNSPERKVPSPTKKGDNGRATSDSESKANPTSESEKEKQDEKIDLEREVPSSTKKGDNDRAKSKSERASRADQESGEKKNNNKESRTVFVVQDGSYFSPDDFDFQKGFEEVRVCQVKNKNNELVFLKEEDFVELKKKYAEQQHQADNGTEDVVSTEEVNRQNSHVGS